MSAVRRKKDELTPEKLAPKVGIAAREARNRAGLTQEEVAERVGISPEVYGRMERGGFLPSTPTLFKLCHVLGVRADVLLGLAAEESATPPQPTQSTQPAPRLELTRDSRRLLRVVRTMDPQQLAAFRRVTCVLVDFKRKRRRSGKTSQEART